MGRPTNQGRFEDEFYKAITGQRWQELDKVTAWEMPSWWEPGMPLTLSPEEVEAKLCSEVVVPDKDDCPEEQEGEGQVAKPPLKRMHVDHTVKQWFLSWSLHMQKSRGWSLSQCGRCAKLLASELVGQIHLSTVWRWRPRGCNARKAGQPITICKKNKNNVRRPTSLQQGELAEALAMARSEVKEGVSFNGMIFQE